MIRNVTLYEGICDGCGRQFEDDGGNITAWGDSADVEFLFLMKQKSVTIKYKFNAFGHK